MPQGLKASDFLNLYQSAQNPKAKGLNCNVGAGAIGSRTPEPKRARLPAMLTLWEAPS